MKLTKENYKNFNNVVVEFNKGIDEIEGYFERGMKAKIERISLNSYTETEYDFRVSFDFSEFEEYNKQFATANYYDDNGVGCLYAWETIFYPKDNKENVCISDASWFKIVDNEEELIIKEINSELKKYSKEELKNILDMVKK